MTGRAGMMDGSDIAAVAAMLIGLGFTAWALAELSDRLRRRISGKVGR